MADNPEEWFDVVDSEDRVTGQARRAEVHARRLLHRAVHILVRRSDGAVFLQQRSLGKDSHPGKWDSSASGHLDAGEAYDAAARRELFEELGIRALPSGIGRLPASPATGYEFVRIYSVEHEGPFSLHPEEIMGGRWLQPCAIDEWIAREPSALAPAFTTVWNAVRASFSMEP